MELRRHDNLPPGLGQDEGHRSALASPQGMDLGGALVAADTERLPA